MSRHVSGLPAGSGSGPSPGAAGRDRATLAAWLRLAHADGIGPIRGHALLRRFGAPEAVLSAHPDELATVLGNRSLVRALQAPDPPQAAAMAAALAWLDGDPEAHAVIALDDPRYPPRLLDLADAPLLLYCRGDASVLAAPQVAIVGSRNATALGSRTAVDLAGALANEGLVVSSGLAEGIDRAAHVGALDGGGLTVAVVGTGIDRVYPARHRPLADRISRAGALIGEQPPGTRPLPANFPRRNRLIAAMAEAVVVVEAAVKSGSLITARLAADLGREVLAVPGSIHSPLARGCHALLRQGAGLVESAGDILDALPAPAPNRVRWRARPTSDTSTAAPGDDASEQGRALDDLSPCQARLLDSMAGDPLRAETLAEHHGWPLAKMLAALQTLELTGRVRHQIDGTWIRRH